MVVQVITSIIGGVDLLGSEDTVDYSNFTAGAVTLVPQVLPDLTINKANNETDTSTMRSKLLLVQQELTILLMVQELQV